MPASASCLRKRSIASSYDDFMSAMIPNYQLPTTNYQTPNSQATQLPSYPATQPPKYPATYCVSTAVSLPPSENSHTLSPRRDAANALPAESTTTYCWPRCSKTLAGALTPAPVWNAHSSEPLRESSAVNRPSPRPMNSTPPAVATDPL